MSDTYETPVDEIRTTSVRRFLGLRGIVIDSSSVIGHCHFGCKTIVIQRCNNSQLRETFASVRGYGLRAYEPRQGRNAATVV